MMEYVKLGQTDLKVSRLCLGTMQFGWTADEADSFEILTAAYDAGVNFIDTADIYSRWAEGNPGGVSEDIIGRWMQSRDIPRDKLVIATKVRGPMGDAPGDQGLSRAHIMAAVEGSLRRLRIEFIDLYQAHWFDEDIPIDETLMAFDDLVREGKVRYIGCSNYPAWRLMQALWASERLDLVRYDSLQPHYNLVHRAEYERELAEVCQAYGLGVIPYSPLAGGFLTGKYRHDASLPRSERAGSARRYFKDPNWDLLTVLEKTGAELGDRTVSQIALAWLLVDPVITSPIIGPRSLNQLEDNLAAQEVPLPPEAKARLDEASAWAG